MFKRLSLAFVALATLVSVTAQNTGAVTFEEIEACANTIAPLDQPEVYSFQSGDPTTFSARWTHDPAFCTPRIAFTLSRLINDEAGTGSSCTLPVFDSTGVITTVCTRQTRGEMADMAAVGEVTWNLVVLYGPRGLIRSLDVYFAVADPNAVPEPVPSGSLQKKRPDNQHLFDCPIGHTWCWTGQGQDYACMDTSSDVSACGQCPYAFGAEQADCTSIEGVDDVECRNSKCVVQACQRGFQISLDRTKCVDGRKRSQPAKRGLLF